MPFKSTTTGTKDGALVDRRLEGHSNPREKQPQPEIFGENPVKFDSGHNDPRELDNLAQATRPSPGG